MDTFKENSGRVIGFFYEPIAVLCRFLLFFTQATVVGLVWDLEAKLASQCGKRPCHLQSAWLNFTHSRYPTASGPTGNHSKGTDRLLDRFPLKCSCVQCEVDGDTIRVGSGLGDQMGKEPLLLRRVWQRWEAAPHGCCVVFPAEIPGFLNSSGPWV